MLLYANVSSERASKGQGGNEYLNIEVTDGVHNTLAVLHVKHGEDKVKLWLQSSSCLCDVLHDELVILGAVDSAEANKGKGKKKKGDHIMQ